MTPIEKGYRLLQTMIRVSDVEKSIEFYSKQLGMKVLRRKDFPGGKFTNVFMGYGEEDQNTVLELTYNWNQEKLYTHGTGFGHLAVAVPDIYDVCERMEKEDVSIPRPPGPMKHSTTVIAFVEDPDGYKIELIERA